jgi:hypothetical protein
MNDSRAVRTIADLDVGIGSSVEQGVEAARAAAFETAVLDPVSRDCRAILAAADREICMRSAVVQRIESDRTSFDLAVLEIVQVTRQPVGTIAVGKIRP